MTIAAPKPDIGRGAAQVLPDDQSSLQADPWSDGWSLPSADALEAIGYPGARPAEALQPRHNGNGVTLEESRQTVEAIRGLYGHTVGTSPKRRANGTSATTTRDVPAPETERALEDGDTTSIPPRAAEIEPPQTAETAMVLPDLEPEAPPPLPEFTAAVDSTPRAAIEAEDPFVFFTPPPAADKGQ